MKNPWLNLFRVVNLPTVPGDVLVGASAVLVGTASGLLVMQIVTAVLASVFLYLFGLVDNDIVGAATDVNRPIPNGQISLSAARLARGVCLLLVMVVAAVADLPPLWWVSAFVLALVIVIYNRSKLAVLMGACRGLNVWCGGVALLSAGLGALPRSNLLALVVCALIWTAYVTFVTRYSEGEETDPGRKRRVGFLIGALVYLQLTALLVFQVRPLLIAGAVLLVALRFGRRLFPEVSAS